jgi:hypothetical protein
MAQASADYSRKAAEVVSLKGYHADVVLLLLLLLLAAAAGIAVRDLPGEIDMEVDVRWCGDANISIAIDLPVGG